MSKHTAGPWVKNKYGEIQSACGKVVDVWGLGVFHTSKSEESHANAVLMISAPDLLAAAERVLAKLDHPTLGVTIYDADVLREAIAKARGEV